MAIATAAFFCLSILAMFGCWATGFVSYLRLAQQAGFDSWQTWFGFRVYGYAFTTAKGSRETWLMVGGFVGTLLFLCAAFAAAALTVIALLTDLPS